MENFNKLQLTYFRLTFLLVFLSLITLSLPLSLKAETSSFEPKSSLISNTQVTILSQEKKKTFFLEIRKKIINDSGALKWQEKNQDEKILDDLINTVPFMLKK